MEFLTSPGGYRTGTPTMAKACRCGRQAVHLDTCLICGRFPHATIEETWTLARSIEHARAAWWMGRR